MRRTWFRKLHKMDGCVRRGYGQNLDLLRHSLLASQDVKPASFSLSNLEFCNDMSQGYGSEDSTWA